MEPCCSLFYAHSMHENDIINGKMRHLESIIPQNHSNWLLNCLRKIYILLAVMFYMHYIKNAHKCKQKNLPVPDVCPLFFHTKSYTWIPFHPMGKYLTLRTTDDKKRKKWELNVSTQNSGLLSSLSVYVAC